MRLSKLYPVLHSVVKAHHINSRLLEREEYSPKDVKTLTLPDLTNLLFLSFDLVSELVEVFGDWYDESSFLFSHRLEIDSTYLQFFPFPLYVCNTFFIVHIPYLCMNASIFMSSMLRGLGYNVYSSYEIAGAVDFSMFKRVTIGLKV